MHKGNKYETREKKTGNQKKNKIGSENVTKYISREVQKLHFFLFSMLIFENKLQENQTFTKCALICSLLKV
jgi:hypothetical protein